MKESIWSRVACGRSPAAVNAGRMFYITALGAAPSICVLAFGSGMEDERIPLAVILACIFGALWLMHAANIRAFCAGDRMTDPFATEAEGMRGIGILGKDVTMRWIAAAISLAFMALEAWFVYMAGSSWMVSGIGGWQ